MLTVCMRICSLVAVCARVCVCIGSAEMGL